MSSSFHRRSRRPPAAHLPPSRPPVSTAGFPENHRKSQRSRDMIKCYAYCWGLATGFLARSRPGPPHLPQGSRSHSPTGVGAHQVTHPPILCGTHARRVRVVTPSERAHPVTPPPPPYLVRHIRRGLGDWQVSPTAQRQIPVCYCNPPRLSFWCPPPYFLWSLCRGLGVTG